MRSMSAALFRFPFESRTVRREIIDLFLLLVLLAASELINFLIMDGSRA